MSISVSLTRTLGAGHARTRETFARIQLALVLVALGLNLTWVPRVRDPLPIPGSTSNFIPDVLLTLAVLSWLASRLLLGSSAGALPRTALLGPVLALFAIALVPGIIRGHERYGASLVGQPLRLVLYAAVALAMTELHPRQVYRAIVGLFYAGTALQAAFACWYLATGTSQSGSYLLSTGGSRTLDIGTSIYLSGALFLVILNLELGFPLRRWVHLTVGALALFGIVLAYDRTTFIALVLLLPLGLWRARHLRSTPMRHPRLKMLAAAAIVLAVAFLTLSFGATLVDRVTANPLQDHNVRWRYAALHQSLAGFRSGHWKQGSPFDQSRNQLANPQFESGLQGWHIQGGRLVSIPSGDRSFGKRSLEFVTDGTEPDQGLFSSPVLTTHRQSWTFTIWLRGASGGERVNVSIWKYGPGGSSLGQANLPVTLEKSPRQFVVTTAVTDPATTNVRALVRTRDAQAVSVIADRASLTTLGHSSVLNGVPYLRVGGGVVDLPAAGGGLAAPDGSPSALTKRSYVGNGGFEDGTTGWSVEGGRLTTIPSNNPAFGSRSLELSTSGSAMNEGFSSSELSVLPGGTWTFLVWLKGTHGGERMQLAMRQYDTVGNETRQTSVPVTLSISPTEYFLTSTLARSTAHIRVSIRTRDFPQAIVIYADDASVRRLVASTGASNSASDQSGRTGFFLEEPLLGLGFGRSFDYIWEGIVYHFDGDPHDDFIWLLAGGGVLAFGAFILLLGSFVRGSWRRLKGSGGYERALVVWALLTWFVFMLNSVTEPILTEPAFLLTIWTLMLLPALVRAGRNGRSGGEKTQDD